MQKTQAPSHARVSVRMWRTHGIASSAFLPACCMLHAAHMHYMHATACTHSPSPRPRTCTASVGGLACSEHSILALSARLVVSCLRAYSSLTPSVSTDLAGTGSVRTAMAMRED